MGWGGGKRNNNSNITISVIVHTHKKKNTVTALTSMLSHIVHSLSTFLLSSSSKRGKVGSKKKAKVTTTLQPRDSRLQRVNVCVCHVTRKVYMIMMIAPNVKPASVVVLGWQQEMAIAVAATSLP